MIVKVGQKTRDRGRRQRVTSSHSRYKYSFSWTRRPSEVVASCAGPELPRDGRRGTRSGEGGGGAKKRKKPQESYVILL